MNARTQPSTSGPEVEDDPELKATELRGRIDEVRRALDATETCFLATSVQAKLLIRLHKLEQELDAEGR